MKISLTNHIIITCENVFLVLNEKNVCIIIAMNVIVGRNAMSHPNTLAHVGYT